jgi:hypothetical protein
VIGRRPATTCARAHQKRREERPLIVRHPLANQTRSPAKSSVESARK